MHETPISRSTQNGKQRLFNSGWEWRIKEALLLALLIRNLDLQPHPSTPIKTAASTIPLSHKTIDWLKFFVEDVKWVAGSLCCTTLYKLWGTELQFVMGITDYILDSSWQYVKDPFSLFKKILSQKVKGNTLIPEQRRGEKVIGTFVNKSYCRGFGCL